MEMHCNFQKEN